MRPHARGVLLMAAMLAVAAGLLATPVAAAGTAFGVDTAEVSDPGNCKIEAWGSHAANADAIVTANPACVVRAFTPTEVSAQITRARTDAEWAATISPKIKAKLVPTAIGSFGFALAAGGTYEFGTREVTSLFAYVPGTLRFSENVRINVNAGWLQDLVADRHFATYGLGLDVRLTETVIFTAETFGQLGGHDPGESATVQPRFQVGLRYRPIDRYSIDLIYGRNIAGENSDWVTLATTLRFPPD